MMVDFSSQSDGLIKMIVDTLDKDPSSGDLLIFRNSFGNKLKCVYFDGKCFWVKRQMKKHGFFPRSAWPQMARQEPDKHCDVSPWMAASSYL